jgi:citrate lyase subunit beta / citryl-CoA lyase
MPMTSQLRSWMFVPGDRQRMIDKALALPVDAIILDLEDGVAPSAKDTARGQIASALDGVARTIAAGGETPHPTRFVRINAIGHERMAADVASVVRPGIDGLVLPKVEDPSQIAIVEGAAADRERATGLDEGSVRLLVAIESPRGLLNALPIAQASPRIVGLMFGGEDFSREIGLPFRREGEALDLMWARSSLVVAAAAAGVQSVDGVWVNLDDPAGLQRHAAQSRRLGFTGCSLIHPAQIAAVNDAFTPGPDEVDYCRRVVAAFEDARERGEGAVAFGGQLLDVPIVDRARRTLALARSLGAAS